MSSQDPSAQLQAQSSSQFNTQSSPSSTLSQSVQHAVQARASPTVGANHSAHFSDAHPHVFRSHHFSHASDQDCNAVRAVKRPVIASPTLSDSNSVSSVASTSSLFSSASSHTSVSTPVSTPVSSPVSSPVLSTSATQRSTTELETTTTSSPRTHPRKTSYFRSSIDSHNNSFPLVPVLSVVSPPGPDGGDGEARRPAMQRVSSFLPSWDKRSSGTRPSLFGWSSNRSSTMTVANSSALARINTAAANANGCIQREAFWPATLDGECEKAARILKSFSSTSIRMQLFTKMTANMFM